MNEMPDIPPFLDRTTLVYTFTNMNTYGICPFQFYRRYIKKDIKYVETPQMKWGNEVHPAFEARLSAGKPLPDNMRQWEHFASAFNGLQVETEMKLGCDRSGKPVDYWDKSVFLRGKVDCVAVLGQQAFIADWKTGKQREEPFELEVGALLLKTKYPEITTIQGSYVWLADNRMGQKHNLSDFFVTGAKIAKIVQEIEWDRQNGMFNKKPGPLCAWCNCLDCEFNRKKT